MKKLLLSLIVLILGDLCLAQDYDPDLINTWALVAIDRDLSPTIYTNDVSPSITPYLKVNPDLSFEGYGACNAFTGQFSTGIDTPPNTIFIPEFEATDNSCDSESQNTYEDAYFFQLDLPVPLYEYDYSITTDADGEPFLTLGPGVGFYLYFKLTTLATEENNNNNFMVYPNPVVDRLNIAGNISANADISIISLSGVKRSLAYNRSGSYDISYLSNGVYVLSITTNHDTQIIKFVKQ